MPEGARPGAGLAAGCVAAGEPLVAALAPAAAAAVAGLVVAHAPDGHGGLFPPEHAVQPQAAPVIARVTGSAARTVAPGVGAPQVQPALSSGVLSGGGMYPLAVAGALCPE